MTLVANSNGVAEKSFPGEDAADRTVQVRPPGQGPFYNDAMVGMFFMAQQADEIMPWGSNIKQRDRALREFIPVESMFAAALGIVAARNAAFSWKLEGPPRKTAKMQKVLESANFGQGWANFVARLTVDLSTQDNGAFFEIIREKDSEDAEVIGIASMDALRCYPTGLPDTPVVYQDRLGQYHTMKWYQVVHILEMPAAYESPPGLQYCALTRIMRSCRIARDIDIYTQEKVGGRNARAVTLVKGVTPAQIDTAWQVAKIQNDAAGLMRYSQPILVGSVDPKADIGFETLELASLPDGFNAKESKEAYTALLAMGFMTDYQEFAPLPGGGLGTSNQSDILDKKSQAKGPGLFMKLVASAMNWSVLPADVEFAWDEQNADAEKLDADTKLVKAQVYVALVGIGVLSAEAARQMMYDDGWLPKEILDMMAQYDANANQTFEDTAPESPDDGGVPPPPGGTTPPVEATLNEGAQPEAQTAVKEETRDAHGRWNGSTGGSKTGGGGKGGGRDEGGFNSSGSGAASHYGKETAKWQKTLPKDLQDVASGKVGQRVAVNEELRKGLPDPAKMSGAASWERSYVAEQHAMIGKMDQLTGSHAYTLPHDVEVYRGVAGSVNLREGSVVKDKAYTYVTTNRRLAMDYTFGGGQVITTHLRAGTKVALGIPDQQEMILPRGARLRVDSIVSVR